jgi:hypothetical protein
MGKGKPEGGGGAGEIGMAEALALPIQSARGWRQLYHEAKDKAPKHAPAEEMADNHPGRTS